MQSPNRSEPIQVTKDELVGALDALDVPYLRGGVRNDVALALAPHELITGFAQSNKARLCYAIIPLLLRHPELAQEAKIADRSCKASRTQHWDFTRQQRQASLSFPFDSFNPLTISLSPAKHPAARLTEMAHHFTIALCRNMDARGGVLRFLNRHSFGV